jgi:chromosome segregation ATPase
METQMNKTRTLNALLQDLTSVDEGMLDMSRSALAETVGEIKDKVDALQEVLSRMKSEQDRLKLEADLFTQKRRELENAEKRLKEYITFCLENGGSEKLVGNRYTLSLQSREFIKAKAIELTSAMYIEINSLRPGTVKREYSFDASQLKTLASENESIKSAFCDVTKSTYPMFRVKKGVN